MTLTEITALVATLHAQLDALLAVELPAWADDGYVPQLIVRTRTLVNELLEWTDGDYDIDEYELGMIKREAEAAQAAVAGMTTTVRDLVLKGATAELYAYLAANLPAGCKAWEKNGNYRIFVKGEDRGFVVKSARIVLDARASDWNAAQTQSTHADLLLLAIEWKAQHALPTCLRVS